MSFWKALPKQAPSEADAKAADMATPTKPPEKSLANLSEKPLPDPTMTVVTVAQPPKRPGTSGTELALVANRRVASQHLQAARRAEQSYKARKRSAAARTSYAGAKTHFAAAAHHFGAGVRLMFEAVRSAPYVVRDRKERRRAAAEERKARKTAAEEKRSAVDDEDERKEVAEGEEGDGTKPEQPAQSENEQESKT